MLKRHFGEQKIVELNDIREVARERLKELEPFLKNSAEHLRAMGFKVADDCRVNIDDFPKADPANYSDARVNASKQKVASLENAFSLDKTPGKEMAKNTGELLEVVKTVTFNEFWFGKRIIAVRTSKFDDYVHGIDELVFDTKTGMVVAVIDTTTSLQTKQQGLIAKALNGGTVDYGFEIKNGRALPRSYKNLPLFVVSLKNEEILDLSTDIKNQSLRPEQKNLESVVLKSIEVQCDQFGKISKNEELKKAYPRIAGLFREISELAYS